MLVAQPKLTSETSRRFYELSKTHHPDRNRNDPQASKIFVKISAAYSILGNPKLREKYDRELQRHRPVPHGSNPVGGRPASGLSRRRTQQQGPPPSYVRSGGWSAFRARNPTTTFNSAGAGGGAESGIWSDVPHFDFKRKQRQHEAHEMRQAIRRHRNARERPDMGTIIPMSLVSGVLFFTVWWAISSEKAVHKKEQAQVIKKH